MHEWLNNEQADIRVEEEAEAEAEGHGDMTQQSDDAFTKNDTHDEVEWKWFLQRGLAQKYLALASNVWTFFINQKQSCRIARPVSESLAHLSRVLWGNLLNNLLSVFHCLGRHSCGRHSALSIYLEALFIVKIFFSISPQHFATAGRRTETWAHWSMALKMVWQWSQKSREGHRKVPLVAEFNRLIHKCELKFRRWRQRKRPKKEEDS